MTDPAASVVEVKENTCTHGHGHGHGTCWPARVASLGSDGGKPRRGGGSSGAAASVASRAARSKRSASSDSASSPSSSLSSSPSGGSSLGSLVAACTPLPAGALRRRAVEERQRWRRPRHLPWRRRPSPASPRAPAQHGSPSIAMRAAAKCLASMSTQLRPVDSTTYQDEERREAGNHRRSASATPGPAGHLRWRLRRRRDARQPWGRVITHILCQQRRTESRTWRHGVRHGERQEQGLGGAFPPPAGRVTETRGGTRGVQQDIGRVALWCHIWLV